MDEQIIQFDTLKFQQELSKCRASQEAAFVRLGNAIYKNAYGLELSAPAEFWRLALGKITIDECIKEIQASLHKTGFTPANKDWQKMLDVIRELSQRTSSMTEEKWKAAKDKRKNDFALIKRWVAGPDHPNLVQASLCFYTWEAMAKIIYKLDWEKPVPIERQKAGSGHRSAEAERIKGHCRRLGLIQSELRLIKDVEIKPNGDIKFVPMGQNLSSE